MNLFTINSKGHNPTKLQTPSGSVSKLDLAASAKAKREYQKGYQALMRNELHPAVQHLAKSITLYPRFVSAHNALGSAYLAMGQNEKARGEFAQAVALDGHLPNSYLNLGCAELALKHYPAAEDALRKASSIAPLDLQLLTALTYAEFVNHDYAATIATAHEVHGIEHRGAAVVHYFAAGAWEAQGNLSEAQHEMETLLLEDPSSASAGKFRQILEEIKTEEATQAAAGMHPVQALTVTRVVERPHAPTAEEAARQAQQALQNTKEKNQIAEAEADPDPVCSSCSKPAEVSLAGSRSVVTSAPQPGINFPGTILRASVDEVAIFFAATDHGKSVTDLTAREIGVRDDSLPPAAILEFRNEAQLPLRLGSLSIRAAPLPADFPSSRLPLRNSCKK